MTVKGGPGHKAGGGKTPEPEPCPFCDGTDTELMSLFGSHASLSTWWCGRCRSPFEVLRWKSRAGATDGPDQASTSSTSV